jgi:quercetin dioxygenase-like cupin family protein
MIRKAEDCTVAVNQSMRGGPGSVVMTELAKEDEMYSKVRMFSRVLLKPGCGIGYHTHQGESEIITMLTGTAVYNDDGTEHVVTAGDVMIAESGHGHGISNDGTEDVEFIALIPLK